MGEAAGGEDTVGRAVGLALRRRRYAVMLQAGPFLVPPTPSS